MKHLINKSTVFSIIFVLFWASGFAFAKMGLNNASPFTLLSLRYFFASIIFLPIFIIIRPALPQSKKTWGQVMLTGLMIQAVYFVFIYQAMQMGVSAGTIAVIVSMQPILVGIFAPQLTGEEVSKLQWFGLFLGLMGTLLVLSQTNQIEFNQLGSISLAFLGLLTMTFVTLFEKRSNSQVHPISSNLIQYLLSFLIITPLAFIFENFNFTLNKELVIALSYLVICNSCISITILLYLIKDGESHKVSAIFFLVPPTAAIISFLLLGEILSIIALLGITITATGVFLVKR